MLSGGEDDEEKGEDDVGRESVHSPRFLADEIIPTAIWDGAAIESIPQRRESGI